MLKGNKGEWTEIYVLAKLLSDGKLFQSDENLEVDSDNVYNVVKVYKQEENYEIEFMRDHTVKIYKSDSSNGRTQINSKSLDEFRSLTELLLLGIKKGKGKVFGLPQMDEKLLDIGIKKVKAKSTSKSDLKIRIYDHRLAKETDLGFSIKSLLGKDSTLFNTGMGNNFIFEISNFECDDLTDLNRKTMSKSTLRSKITDRINLVEDQGGSFKYKGIQSPILWKNLKMVDGDLPEILAWALYYRFKTRDKDLVDVCKKLECEDPLNYYNGEESIQKFYFHKIQRFLVESAMGMTSEKVWDGEYDSFGGVIIAKKDGDVVCFHIYDFNILRRYLINNTYFEQPAGGEDETNPGTARTTGKKFHYGWVYNEDGKLNLKLNLQVRFHS